ncbi:MAG: response regulator, partial [Candidatus Odinarchaeota archaeon]
MVTILHVDDEKEFSEITRTFLKRIDSNLGIDHTSSVNEALDLAKRRAYDVIISDYRIPSKDGLEFLKELKKRDISIPF